MANQGSSSARDTLSARTGLLAGSLLRGVPRELVEELARVSVQRTFEADQPLWRADELAQSFVVIARGLVRIERTMPSGDPAIMAIFGPRESIGETAAVQGGRYPASAIATSPIVEVVQLPAVVLRAQMESDPRLADAVHNAVLRHTQALRAKIDIMSAGSVAARLAALLLHLAERFGDEDEQAMTSVPVALSRSALAQLVSARTETVIRTLAGWQREGIVRSADGGFEIADLARLQELTVKG